MKAYRPEPGLNKQMRLNAQTGIIENGFVHLPKQAEWLDAYLHELTTLPGTKYDDQVDSTAQALHWIKVGQKSKTGLNDYYEQLLREQGYTVLDEPPYLLKR